MNAIAGFPTRFSDKVVKLYVTYSSGLMFGHFNKNNNIEQEEDDQTSEEENQDSNKLIPLRVIEGKRRGHVSLDEDKETNITFSDVGGLDELKETIRMKIIKPFTTPGLSEKFKKKSYDGVRGKY
jgi:hypothetical protein